MSVARELRVLRVLARSNLGGPARQLRALARHLPAQEIRELRVHGHIPPGEIELALDGSAPQDPRRAEAAGTLAAGDVRLPGLGPAEGPGSALMAWTGLLRLIRSFRPDLLHTHTARAGLLGALAGRVCGVPVLHSFHGHVLRDHFGILTGRALQAVERRLAPLRRGFHCVGEGCAAELAALGVVVPERCVVIPPTIDPELVDRCLPRAEARRVLGIAPDERAVAWIGRLVPVKDPALAVATWRHAVDGRPGLGLHVFGEGPQAAVFEDAARTLPIRVHGARADLPRLLQAFDVLLSSSLREGQPLAVLEALITGVPVVAPRAPGLVDLEGPGLRLCARRPDALAEALGSPDPVPEERRAALRRRHDPETLARRYAALYRNLLPAGARMGDPLRPATALR